MLTLSVATPVLSAAEDVFTLEDQVIDPAWARENEREIRAALGRVAEGLREGRYYQ